MNTPIELDICKRRQEFESDLLELAALQEADRRKLLASAPPEFLEELSTLDWPHIPITRFVVANEPNIADYVWDNARMCFYTTETPPTYIFTLSEIRDELGKRKKTQITVDK